MNKPYDILIFIGRFQPFHNGHKRVVDHALTLANDVLILVGSSNLSVSIRNPFTFEERKAMIEGVYPDQSITIKPINDVMYNDDLWIKGVQKTVTDEVLKIVNKNCPNIYLHGVNDARIGLIGCNKDSTSYYLKLFPNWVSESVKFEDPINATDIRTDMFTGNISRSKRYLPTVINNFLNTFIGTTIYKSLVNEYNFIKDYKISVQKYPRIEHTVDAVVIQSGHILLIKRRAEPGKGLWALPGGFVNLTETLENAMIRELKEETMIKVPDPVLRGSIVTSRVFDNPNRSLRGRIITQAYLIKLSNQVELPKIKGADDAEKAKWVPLSELKANILFEDHFFIIQKMIGEI